MGKKISRRKFLTSSVTGAAGLALAPIMSSCMHLEQMIVGNAFDETKRVVILGAGTSGLVAARQLRKLGIPFRIFEGSNRIGGRVQTVDDFNVASQIAEMGAEWIGDKDGFVHGLCHELKIQLKEIPEPKKLLSFYGPADEGAEWADEHALRYDLKIIDRALLEFRQGLTDQQLDALPVSELVTYAKKKISGRAALWLTRISQYEWGAEPEEVSALSYYERFQNMPSGFQRILDRRWKIQGGTQVLTQALYDKIAGVIPDRFVTFGHTLRGMQTDGEEVELSFETATGVETVRAHVVICALPFSVLREISGIEDMEFSENKLRAIREIGYGTHAKMSASFENRFWKNEGAIWTGDIATQWFWEASAVGVGPLAVTRGVLTAQMGGRLGAQAGLHSLEAWKKDFHKMKISKPVLEENFQIMNWGKNHWSKGSVAFLKPTQVLSISETLPTPERTGSFIFAGEHTSTLSMGTLNGAIESGLRAAMQASKFKSKLDVV